MKKKTVNIVLIIAVVSIWGVLLYKFFRNKPAPNLGSQELSLSSGVNIPQKIEKDTFTLNFYERDPFLGSLRGNYVAKKKATNDTTSTKNGSKRKLKKMETSMEWPPIDYLGFVQESNSKEPLLLLKINNKLHRKKIDAEFPLGLKVERFYQDSIVLKLFGESKTIRK